MQAAPTLVCCFWDNAWQQAKIRILTFPLHLCHRDHTPSDESTQEVTHCWTVNLCLWPSLGGKGRNHLILICTFQSTFTVGPVQGSKQAPEGDKPNEKWPQEILTWGGSGSEDHVSAGGRGGTAWRGPHGEHDSPRTCPTSHGWSCHCNSIGSCWSWERTFQQVSPYSM